MSKPREVKFLGVPMRCDQNEVKVPTLPGWKLVSAVRQPFGAALLYERVDIPLEAQ